jgi:hypothetical protein
MWVPKAIENGFVSRRVGAGERLVARQRMDALVRVALLGPVLDRARQTC